MRVRRRGTFAAVGGADGRSRVMEMATTHHEGERLLRRVEYELLAKHGHFDDEKVELLFGRVVPMTPIGPPHSTSTSRLHNLLVTALGTRAEVRSSSSFAASDVSEPQPDVFVVPPADYWHENPTRAQLVVEVAQSSLARDRGLKLELYGLAEVDEYWIVDLVHGCVEVYRDRRDGRWETLTTHRRGEHIAMAAFPDVAIAVDEILPPA
jgi:Uma2 family endonuclease